MTLRTTRKWSWRWTSLGATCAMLFLGGAFSGLQAAVLTGSNNTLLEWNGSEGEVTLFPSSITLVGTPAGGVITDVVVSLTSGTGHSFASDLEITLSFGGTVITLMQDAGGGAELADGVTITFSLGNPLIPFDGTGFTGAGRQWQAAPMRAVS